MAHLEIIRIDFDVICMKCSKGCRIEYACFSFRVGLPFFMNLSYFKLDTQNNGHEIIFEEFQKITRILTLYQANVPTLTRCNF